jgi:prepilin-type N-terminal cleavage/methylation domain-containing protein
VSGRQGVTLLELLVVMALSGVVMGLVVNFFAVQTRVAERQNAINQVNESSRVALMILSWDLHIAGYNVPVTHTRPALQANQPSFKVALRYHQADMNRDRQVRYAVGGSPVALRRTEFDDGSAASALQPAVAGIVALNIMYETRAVTFRDFVPAGSTACPAGTLPFPPGAHPPVNCEEPWVFKSTPDRFVRQAVIRLVARSDTRLPGYRSDVDRYDLGGGTSYRTEPGYMYRYAEQTVVTRNLGW